MYNLLQEWHKYFNNRHVRHRVAIPKNSTCSSPASALPRLELTVTHAANYFFVLVTHRHEPDTHQAAGDATLSLTEAARDATLSLTGRISKTQYDVSGAESVCSANETSCRFPLSWGSEKDVVARVVLRAPGDPDAPASFFTDCKERVEFWVPIFGVAPVVAVTLISLWCWCLLVRKRSLRSRYRQPQSGQVSNAGYGSMDEESTPIVAEAPPSTAVAENGDGCASIQG